MGTMGFSAARRLGHRGWFVLLFLLTGIFFITGCVPEVYKQNIPISTNPMGAKVYVDGKPAGETPTAVELERTQSHVITLVKEDFRQADVVIHRKKNSEEQLFKAVNSGVSTGMFFKDPTMGMMRGMDAYNMQEKTGEAYTLYPSAVTVNLEPLNDAKAAPSQVDPNSPEGQETPRQKETGTEEAADQPNGEAMAKGALGAAAMAVAATMGTREKRWETSSSTHTSVQPDGTVVTKKSSTSVGVSVNPAGILNLIDVLYK